MKKMIYKALFLALAGIVVISCKKEQLTQSVSSDKQITHVQKSGNASSLTDGITVEDGLLRFQNENHIKQTIDGLYQLYLEHEEAFLAAHPNVHGDDLILVEEETGFNDYAPYEEFESALSFNSLRSKINQEAIAYYASEVDDDNNPDNHFILEDAVRTVLNKFEEVKIGDAIYKFYEHGYIKIVDGDFSTLLQIREDQNLVSSLDNVEIEGMVGTSAKKTDYVCDGSLCDGFSSDDGKYTVGNNRIEWRVAIQHYPWSKYVIAESTNFKKSGGWKKTRAYTFCRVWGSVSNSFNGSACSGPTVFNSQNASYSDQYDTKEWQHKLNVPTKTHTNWVHGQHKSSLIAQYNSTLTF
jgi:hypothetical protein